MKTPTKHAAADHAASEPTVAAEPTAVAAEPTAVAAEPTVAVPTIAPFTNLKQANMAFEELLEMHLDLRAKVEALSAEVEALRAKPATTTQAGTGARSYGPKSTRKMQPADAWRILYGDLKGVTVNDLSTLLGLSKGQIYSVLGTYTFTYVKETDFEIRDGEVCPRTSA